MNTLTQDGQQEPETELPTLELMDGPEPQHKSTFL